MLKFFRTIRKKLIEQDNVRKYLLYAIGEILLVVIGILIALQVNNWNEERWYNIQSDQVLSELKEEVVDSRTEMKEVLQYIQTKAKDGIKFLNNTDTNLPDSVKINEISDLVFFFTERIRMPVLENELGSDKKINQWPELTDSMQQLNVSIEYYNKGLDYMENDRNLNISPFLIQNGLIIDMMAQSGMLESVKISSANIYDSKEFRNIIANYTLMTNALLDGAQNILDQYDELLIVIDKGAN